MEGAEAVEARRSTPGGVRLLRGDRQLVKEVMAHEGRGGVSAMELGCWSRQTTGEVH